jgi:hypothetical protein
MFIDLILLTLLSSLSRSLSILSWTFIFWCSAIISETIIIYSLVTIDRKLFSYVLKS